MPDRTERLPSQYYEVPRPKEIELVIDQGPDSGKRFPIALKVTVGTNNECDVCLTDPFVSKKHCQISIEGKSIKIKDLESTNGTYLSNRKIHEENLQPFETVKIGQTFFSLSFKLKDGTSETCGTLSSKSPQMKELFRHIQVVAKTDEIVLIQGETGTGKELVARALHQLKHDSNDPMTPFIAINCGALASEVIESELFGHTKGAFTGADRIREGAFVAANRGTIFLDEIGELPLNLQPKLLRVLEIKEVKPVGADQVTTFAARVIAATNRDLKREVETGRFREDLFYRLNLIPLYIPPLRERKEDLRLLIDSFLMELGGKIAPEAKKILLNYNWPGNVRELKHVLTRSYYLSKHRRIEIDDLLLPAASDAVKSDIFSGVIPPLNEIERYAIAAVLKQTNYNKTQAAKLLNVSKSTLIARIRKYGL